MTSTAVHSYTNEQRSQAKALALVLGNAVKAAAHLEGLWEVSPTSQSINGWLRDPDIQPDMSLVKTLSNTVDAKVIGYVDRLLAPLEERAQKEIKDGKSGDVINVIKGFVFTANLIRPANATGAGGSNQYTQINDYRGASFSTYGPAEMPGGDVIEGEVVK
jgi:hypothetical protein